MNKNTPESFLFANMTDKYIYSILNLIKPKDDYIFRNDYSNKITQINNLAPEKNKIAGDAQERLFISDVLNSFSLDFFEVYGSPTSSSANNYFSLKKGIPATNSGCAFDFFVFINMVVRRLLIIKLMEIEFLSFIERYSPKINRVKNDLISSVLIIDRNLNGESVKNNSAENLSINRFGKIKYSPLNFTPDKKTLSKRINILNIASFSNSSLLVSEIHKSTKENCFLINDAKEDVFFVDDDFKITKASLAFSLTKCVFIGKRISSIKKHRSLIPFISKSLFYIPSETSYDKKTISRVETEINEIRDSGSFIMLDESGYSLELLSPYDHYISFLSRNNYFTDMSFFKNILSDKFYASRDRARETISKINRMIRDGQVINIDDCVCTDTYNEALKLRNSMIEKTIGNLEDIKKSGGGIDE